MATAILNTTIFQPNMRNSNGQGVIQVNKNDTNVTLYGSLDGVTYVLIETFTASVIKEIILCPFFRISSATDGTLGTSIGTSTVFIDETRSA